MHIVDLIPAPYRLLAKGVLLIALVGGSAASAWKVQDWRYGRQLEQQARLQAESLNQQTLAAAAQQQAEQAKRLALEQRLSASEQTHYRALSDAQRDQGRLRDRLATADLRLSVLLDATDSASGGTVSAATTTGGVVHGATRAQLDPAHAQRIIGITDTGDQGLIALAACQAYIQNIILKK
ncbi:MULTISPECIES: lysis system i-spanin subunit Rz [Gammaproteobacteria]|uniref:lysis system i-spanin subunit Rz n=1 Tax=Gammaproteobacteria TaxID=1236 RepID=UPI00191192C6|nr:MULTISPECIES: lysis system i-spanin subunit Rz [Gammaproteobacteria]MBK5299719.1 lysis protein [Bacillus sp. TH86]MBK5319488.1 lysis protein [Bacillus sp. TH59]MBK5334438.1 lysis protein [Bacillus sp. TH57]MBK5308528.1 lysis protein [Pseudomonas sp. TH71]MBK5313987.1 lysis protein [Erwinia sp. TH79]